MRLKLFVTPSVWPATAKEAGAVVSKTQLTCTISDLLPASSRARTQIILAPSPVNSKEVPTPLVHEVPWSKENSQSMPGLFTAHTPFLVMPSLTLQSVSLNEKSGALRVNAAFI